VWDAVFVCVRVRVFLRVAALGWGNSSALRGVTLHGVRLKVGLRVLVVILDGGAMALTDGGVLTKNVAHDSNALPMASFTARAIRCITWFASRLQSYSPTARLLHLRKWKLSQELITGFQTEREPRLPAAAAASQALARSKTSAGALLACAVGYIIYGLPFFVFALSSLQVKRERLALEGQ
jgi:hypothetical protein